MRLNIGLALVLAFGSAPLTVTSAEPETDIYKIAVSYETRSESSDGKTSGSSGGSNLYVERHLLDPDGCTLREFDVVDNPAQTRPLAQWKLPVEVRQCGTEELKLANADEMLRRLDTFLEAIDATREACGSHYFTWTAFEIDCEPQAALDFVRYFDLANLRLVDGASISLPSGAGDGVLVADETDVNRWSASGSIEPAYLRDEAIRTARILDEISGGTLSFDRAMDEIKGKKFSGTFFVEVERDIATGRITREVRIETMTTNDNGVTQKESRREVTTRERAGSSRSRPLEFSI